MLKYAVSIVSFAIGLRLANAAIDYALDKGAEALAKVNQGAPAPSAKQA